MQYYVYAYIRKSDNTPYYIGKGKNNRAFSKDHNVSVPRNKFYIVFMEQNLTELGALALERRYISWYGRKDTNTGILYNRTDGGDTTTGYIVTEETKKKISKSLTGVKKPKSHGKKISDFRKTFKYTEESKLKMSNAKKGKKLTPEQCKNISESQIGRKQPASQKIKLSEALSKNYQIIDPSGNIFEIKNLRNFCKENNLDQGNMSRGKHKGWKAIKVDK